MSRSIEIACKSDVGMVRSENQDHFGVLEPDDPALLKRRGALVVVADGMGGHTGGTIASRTAVDNLLQTFEATEARAMREMVDEAIRAGNSAVRKLAEEKPELKDMGTTCVAVHVRGPRILVGHLGDSRCYLLRKGRLEQVTRDHTYLNELIDMGLLTREQAEGHPDKNIITRCVGMSQELDIDYNMRTAEPGDVLVLCSDGLTNMVRDPEILEIVDGTPAQQACDRLVTLANERGGDDNITVAIVRVLESLEPDEELLKIDDEEVPRSQDSEMMGTTVRLDDGEETVSTGHESRTPTSGSLATGVGGAEGAPAAPEDAPALPLDDDLDETIRSDGDSGPPRRKDVEGRGEAPATHPAWFWIIGAEIVILVLLQIWISRL